MATRRWSVNTVRRRLVELNRFAGWLVERRYLQRSPMIGVSVPRRERRLELELRSIEVEAIGMGQAEIEVALRRVRLGDDLAVDPSG